MQGWVRPRCKVFLLYACTADGLIGRNGTLPWDCPEDLAHFKKTTEGTNKAVLMGYKTWESLPVGKVTGEKLIGRKKIVATRKTGLKPLKDTIFVNNPYSSTLGDIVSPLGITEVYAIGGSEILTALSHDCSGEIVTTISRDIVPDKKPEDKDVYLGGSPLLSYWPEVYRKGLSEHASVGYRGDFDVRGNPIHSIPDDTVVMGLTNPPGVW